MEITWTVCFLLLIAKTAYTIVEPDQIKLDVKCSKCGPGYYVKQLCDGTRETECEQCPDGFYTDSHNLLKECIKCSTCDETFFEFKLCHASHNVRCEPCSSTTFTHSEAFKKKCKEALLLPDTGSGDNIKEIAVHAHTEFTKLPEVADIGEGSGVIMYEPTSVEKKGPKVTLSPGDATVDELLPLKPTDTSKLESNRTGIVLKQNVDILNENDVELVGDSEVKTEVENDVIDVNISNDAPSSQVNSPAYGEGEAESITQDDDDKGMIALVVIVLSVVLVLIIIGVVLARKKCRQKKFNIMRKANGTNGFVKNGVQKDNGSQDEGVFDESDDKPINGTYCPTQTPPVEKEIGPLFAKPVKNSLNDPYLSRDSIKFIDETDDEGLKASTTDRLLTEETSFSDHNDSGITDSTEGDVGNNASKEEAIPMLPKQQKVQD